MLKLVPKSSLQNCAIKRPSVGQEKNYSGPKVRLYFLINDKGGFKSEDTGKILRVQNKYSKSNVYIHRKKGSFNVI